MQWVWEELSFRGRSFEVAHFEALAEGDDHDVVPEELTLSLDRCETELGACLWHDTNNATLQFLADHRSSYEGLRVLELGAGAGVCGIALALEGASATTTDFDALVPLLELNAAHNGFGSKADATTDGEAARRTRKPRKAKGSRAAKKADPSQEWPDEGGDVESQPLSNVAPAKLSAKERREARAQARAQTTSGREVAGEEDEASAAGDASHTKTSLGPSCAVAACDWLQEARSPALPERAFELAIVCDCLYENKDSWDALEIVVKRVLIPGTELILASATLRRPFLEEFTSRLQRIGFDLVADQVTEHARVVALRCPKPNCGDAGAADVKPQCAADISHEAAHSSYA